MVELGLDVIVGLELVELLNPYAVEASAKVANTMAFMYTIGIGDGIQIIREISYYTLTFGLGLSML